VDLVPKRKPLAWNRISVAQPVTASQCTYLTTPAPFLQETDHYLFHNSYFPKIILNEHRGAILEQKNRKHCQITAVLRQWE
jgi:hypothetical protein